MNFFNAGFAGILFMFTLTVHAQTEDKPSRENDKALTSYSLGVQTSRTFVKDDVDIDIDMFVQGLKDGVAGKQLLVTDEQLHKLINDFQSDLRRNLKKTRSIAAGENMRKGKEFLDENRKKPNVVTLPSGLQYLVIKDGDGKKPVDADTVECNYKGTLINGTQFDANDAGSPATMKVTQVISGMKEALKLMSVGSHWQLFIPSQLAYGPRAVGAEIGPNETLIFDLELVSIK